MADMGASVLARLKNKAAETGRSNQLCLQLFCQEEFLRRVEKSRYSENLVLKGGLFLYTLTKLIDMENTLKSDNSFETYVEAKKLGYTDKVIEKTMGKIQGAFEQQLGGVLR